MDHIQNGANAPAANGLIIAPQHQVTIVENDQNRGVAHERGHDGKDVSWVDLEGVTYKEYVPKNFDPFADIQVEDLQGANTGVKASARAVTMTQVNQDGELEPLHIGTVGPNYLLVPHQEMVDRVQSALDQSPFEWKPIHLYANKGQLSKVWVNPEGVLVDGTSYHPVAALWNSYDGSMAARVQFAVLKKLCLNLYRRGEVFGEYVFRHDKGNVDWAQNVEALLSSLNTQHESVQDFVDSLVTLKRMPFERSMIVRLLEHKKIAMYPKPVQLAAVKRFFEKEEQTAYGLLNAMTYAVTHNHAVGKQQWDRTKEATDAVFELAA